MLTIRLARIGKKNKPMYRLIISEKGRDPYGRPLEILGSYNPHNKDLRIKAERIKYWLSKGSGLSPTVNNLLAEKKIIEGKKVKAFKMKADKTVHEEVKKEEKKEEAPAAEEKNEEKEETKETMEAEKVSS